MTIGYRITGPTTDRAGHPLPCSCNAGTTATVVETHEGRAATRNYVRDLLRSGEILLGRRTAG